MSAPGRLNEPCPLFHARFAPKADLRRDRDKVRRGAPPSVSNQETILTFVPLSATYVPESSRP
jgi:hypothetical protein